MYTIGQIAKMANLTVKTLRYYDEIGLLKPHHIGANHYRYYSSLELAKLRRILLFRSMGLSLEDIRLSFQMNTIQLKGLLQERLAQIFQERARQSAEINLILEKLSWLDQQERMNDMDKMTALEKMIQENEATYGREIREKYGESTVDSFNQQVLDMSDENFQRLQVLNQEIERLLKEGVAAQRPVNDISQQVVKAHREWLSLFAPKGMDLQQYQLAMVEMYKADERFAQYYENIISGATDFLYQSVKNDYRASLSEDI